MTSALTSRKLPPPGPELLKLAIESFEEIEKDSRYRIDMDFWHQPAGMRDEYPLPDRPCYVCLAGAVMALELNAPHGEEVFPEYFDEETTRSLHWLNSVRLCAGSYTEDPEQFKARLRNIQLDMETYE